MNSLVAKETRNAVFDVPTRSPYPKTNAGVAKTQPEVSRKLTAPTKIASKFTLRELIIAHSQLNFASAQSGPDEPTDPHRPAVRPPR
jgi:hypothetical protein